MDRRGFLAGLTTSVAAALSGCGTSNPTRLVAAAPLFTPPHGIVQVPVPDGMVTMLPGHKRLVALTVDDGTDADVLKAYILLAKRTGLRLTFFANGITPSWTEHAPLLRPLVDQGQAIICNHTYTHSDLTQLSDYQIADEIQKNENFLNNLYGTNGRPFLRPPYGNHNARTDQMISALGYPAVTMWWGSFGDATSIPSHQVLANARQWLLPQRLVIGHANHPGVLTVMDQIVDIIRRHKLQPVHLADIFDVTKLPPVPPMPTT
ncbi:MAG TPA: polysaccharide deacetylase family protein [Marmoricola sp.]|nr:polysaccharide deacetylase family protein [Marmoricola sp.]